MELTKVFTPEQFEQGLESWHWIGLEGKVPVLASLFGDVVFRAEDGFWWLDTIEGSLTRPWEDADAVRAELNTVAGQERYLLVGLVRAAVRQGLAPAAEQVYDFKHPPVLGGEVDLDNLEVIDFAVGLNIAGQIHEQVRDLPPGSPITGITMS
ncbi:T6SS immunity protein Tdi1 domain-containing protein [Planomonospora corallina]|uniref:T6SS immunity protein Tdi1 domain-containing protein n=2 Tax=Planomonospora corallina TaxID=1806052 RepID=A0ABV8IDI7_9ACTN